MSKPFEILDYLLFEDLVDGQGNVLKTKDQQIAEKLKKGLTAKESENMAKLLENDRFFDVLNMLVIMNSLYESGLKKLPKSKQDESTKKTYESFRDDLIYFITLLR